MQLALPKGYVAIPVSVEQQAAALRVCVVVRVEADPIAGHLVTLRTTLEAQVLLGVVADAAGNVLEPLEIWVQDLRGLGESVPACREAMSNAALDERWKRHFALLVQTDRSSLIQTGWETAHPLPVFLDLGRKEPVHPLEEQTGSPWRLCEDEAALAGKALPAYGGTLHRYLYVPAMGGNSRFVPVTPGAPTNAGTMPMEELAPPQANLVPLNPGGGLMLVRQHCPVDFEAFVTLLGGGRWDGTLHGRTAVDLGGAASALSNKDISPSGEGRIFLGRHGRWGRLIETFHLKLRMLADAVEAVSALVQSQQRPLLNLRAESFRVRVGEPSTALPLLWTARAELVDGGDAVALPIRTSDAQYFLRGGSPGVSVYWPAMVGKTVQGQASVRIRQVLPADGGLTVLEGTAAVQEKLEIARNDLMWVRVALGSGPADLYARLESQTALAGGEWRFRTVGQRLSAEQAAALKAAEGVPVAGCPFELIPLLSAPCDLYSLAVLAIRTLLVNDGTTLPAAVDEVISLARQVAAEGDQTPLAQRIRGIVQSDKRWFEPLGPHRLTSEPLTVEEAFDLVPAELWWDVLAMVVRMLPGVGPDSVCKDYSDFGGGGLQRVFEGVLADLQALLLRTRSLIVIDWRFNREIHAVIRGLLKAPGAARA